MIIWSCCSYWFYTRFGTLMFYLEFLFILGLQTMFHFDVLFGVVVDICFTHLVAFWFSIWSCCSLWFTNDLALWCSIRSCCSYLFYTLCGILIFDLELLFIMVLHTIWHFEVLFGVVAHICFTNYIVFWSSIGSCCSYWFYTRFGILIFDWELLFILVLHTMWHFDVLFKDWSTLFSFIYWAPKETIHSIYLTLFYSKNETLTFFVRNVILGV